MKSDYHVHSIFSDDSNIPMERQIKQAIALNLDELCFTDHVDYGVKYDSGDPMLQDYPYAYNVNYENYFPEIERMREKFSDRLTIKAGLEFGVQTHTIKQYQKLFAKYQDKLDFILLSVHQINNQQFWDNSYQEGKTQAEYNRGYYEELLRVIQNYHDYSVLAHMDLIVRYDHKGVYPFSKVKDIAAEILKTAINDNKGIEFNSSCWRYGLNDTHPNREILRMYRDFGGEILTIGSDAHTPGYIYDHIDDAKEILRGLGYQYFCTFDGMKPSFHTL